MLLTILLYKDEVISHCRCWPTAYVLKEIQNEALCSLGQTNSINP